MGALLSSECGQRRPVWRAWICALLVVLILYNPFLALTSASDGLAYQALARHRATVGASEMQHFAPVQDEHARPQVNIDVAVGEQPPANEETVPLILEREHLALLQEGLASLWFRPPPRP